MKHNTIESFGDRTKTDNQIEAEQSLEQVDRDKVLMDGVQRILNDINKSSSAMASIHRKELLPLHPAKQFSFDT